MAQSQGVLYKERSTINCNDKIWVTLVHNAEKWHQSNRPSGMGRIVRSIT